MSTSLDDLLQAITLEPSDELLWQAVADWLEEHDRNDEAELLRLHRRLLAAPEGDEKLDLTNRVTAMLESGVPPVGPRLTNSLGMEFALIPSGVFHMGSTRGDEMKSQDELPRHPVEITRAFWLGVYTVTQ